MECIVILDGLNIIIFRYTKQITRNAEKQLYVPTRAAAGSASHPSINTSPSRLPPTAHLIM